MLQTYDIKIFEHKQERETIGDLSYVQMHPLREILMRHNIDFHLFRRKIVTRIVREGGKKNAVQNIRDLSQRK